jgi:flagellar motility protein MotE (MotC chaperone)
VDGGDAFWSFVGPLTAASAEAQEAGTTADPQSAAPVDAALEGELSTVLVALKERETRIREREAALDERQRGLELAEQEIRASLVALTEAEAALRQTIALADGAAQRDLERLTRMYETMKPKEAAALFETMDPNFAAGFLSQMTPPSAARILEGLDPETAYIISAVMAGRNMNVPRE